MTGDGPLDLLFRPKEQITPPWGNAGRGIHLLADVFSRQGGETRGGKPPRPRSRSWGGIPPRECNAGFSAGGEIDAGF
jgi:hypothetical protein